jgi:hypothetical protein
MPVTRDPHRGRARRDADDLDPLRRGRRDYVNRLRRRVVGTAGEERQSESEDGEATHGDS